MTQNILTLVEDSGLGPPRVLSVILPLSSDGHAELDKLWRAMTEGGDLAPIEARSAETTGSARKGESGISSKNHAETNPMTKVTDELKPCPFCETPLHDHGHCFSHPRPKSGDCILRHYSFSDRDQWNTRASHPDDAVIERVARALVEADGLNFSDDAMRDIAATRYRHYAIAALKAIKEGE